MSRYYKHLNLPLNPLKEGLDFDSLFYSKIQKQFNLNPLEILNQNVCEFFSSYDLKHAVITVFRFHQGRSIASSLLHSDILRVNENWLPVSYGINWELTGDNTIFTWWQTQQKKFFPMDPRSFNFNPQGIHYGGRLKHGVDDNDILLESVNTGIGPLLVRTDIPHLVYWPKQIIKNRVAISLRFNDGHKISWDDCVEKFSNILI